MKKEEILQQVPWLTDSVFRTLVRQGVIITESKGRGIGRGKGTESATYADNAVDNLQAVERNRKSYSVRIKDLIYAVLWDGHLVDFEKLRERLFTDFDKFIKSLDKAGAILDDPESLQDVAKSHLPPMKPGKPSNSEIARRTVLENKEIESLRTHFDLAKRIAGHLPVGEQILTITKCEAVMEEAGLVELIENWISIEKWRSLIREATVNDLREVHSTILLLREYVFIFRKCNPEMYETYSDILELFKRPHFLKVYTFFLLIPGLREFVMSFNEPEKKEMWKELCRDPERLRQMKGGEAP